MKHLCLIYDQPSWKQVGHMPYIGISKNFFPVESTNDIKIKINHLKVIEDECIWEGISLMNAF